MAALSQPGNHYPAAGVHYYDPYTDQEILASTAAGRDEQAIQLAPGQGLLLAGALLKREDDGTAYVRADASDAQCVLRLTTDTDIWGGDHVFNGTALFGAVVDLGQLQLANSGVTIADGLIHAGSHVNANIGHFTF